MKTKESSFQMNGIYIDYFTYKKNEDFIGFENKPVEIKIDLDLKKKQYDFKNRQANICLIIKIFESTPEFPYFAELSVTGEFAADAGITEKNFKMMSEINAPTIMYPYIRTIITTLTSQSGFPPLILPLINVYKTIKHSKTNSKKQVKKIKKRSGDGKRKVRVK